MKLFIPVVFLSLLACSCESSRLAADSQANNAPNNKEASASNAPQQVTDKAPAFQADKTEVYRPAGEGSQNTRSLQNLETK